MRLGVIADDFTGATDIAGFLVENGLSTVQLIGVPDSSLSLRTDAVVISLKSRSCLVGEAISSSIKALNWLRAAGCDQFFFKYCSTFDSTAEGNIGPVTDALLAELGEDFTVICPALPVNGRTVYRGYLFVGDVLLNESGMRHHPITPMHDANLLRLMDRQSKGQTGNIPAQTIDAGEDAVRAALATLRDSGIRYAVVDALDDRHLTVLGRAVEGMALVTGGSGLGAGIARAVTSRNGRSGDDGKAATAGAPPGGRAVILSGSCSPMTNAQVAAYAHEAPVFFLDVAACLADPDRYATTVTGWAETQNGKCAPLVSATTGPDSLKAIQQNFGAEAASAAVERFFARLAPMLKAKGFDHIIVAGGETSGTIVQSLGIDGFHIGPQIAPGVPWVRAINTPLSLALKSGNFGDERFFFKAQSFFLKGTLHD